MQDCEIDDGEAVLYDDSFHFGSVLAKQLHDIKVVKDNGIEERWRAYLVEVVDIYSTFDE